MAYETIKYNGYKLKINPDTEAENPREYSGPLGTLAFFGRYVGHLDESGLDQSDYANWAKMAEDIGRIGGKGTVILPVYAYVHGITRLKVGSFAGMLPEGHAQFDSFQVGFIYATREKILEYSKYLSSQWQRITPARRKIVEQALRSEISELDSWVSGDTWWIDIKRKGRLIESINGFGYQEMIRDAKSIADADAREHQTEEVPAC